MHEVERLVHTLESASDGITVEDVPDRDFDFGKPWASGDAGGIADEDADAVPGGEQLRDQPPADVAGRARDENACLLRREPPPSGAGSR